MDHKAAVIGFEYVTNILTKHHNKINDLALLGEASAYVHDRWSRKFESVEKELRDLKDRMSALEARMTLRAETPVSHPWHEQTLQYGTQLEPSMIPQEDHIFYTVPFAEGRTSAHMKDFGLFHNKKLGLYVLYENGIVVWSNDAEVRAVEPNTFFDVGVELPSDGYRLYLKVTTHKGTKTEIAPGIYHIALYYGKYNGRYQLTVNENPVYVAA